MKALESLCENSKDEAQILTALRSVRSGIYSPNEEFHINNKQNASRITIIIKYPRHFSKLHLFESCAHLIVAFQKSIKDMAVNFDCCILDAKYLFLFESTLCSCVETVQTKHNGRVSHRK